MKKMWKNLSGQEKGMVLIIIMLLIGVMLRWGFIKKEAGESVRGMFRADTTRNR